MTTDESQTNPERLGVVGSGKVYAKEEKGTIYTYLNPDATRALGLDDGDELDVYKTRGGLLAVPKDGNELPETVRCRHCDHVNRPAEMWDHHVNQHPGKRYDPTWYDGVDA